MSEQEDDVISFIVPQPPCFCAKCNKGEETETTKLLKCARCQLARYCSRKCQREHFTLHKHCCKAISILRKASLEDGDRVAARGLLADAIVSTTYRSSATMEQGFNGYAAALSLYLEDDDTPAKHASKVPLLWAVLGLDDASMSFMKHGTIVSSQDNDDILLNPKRNVTHLVTGLFIRMRIVANLERDRNNYKVFKRTTLGRKLKRILRIQEYIVGESGWMQKQRAQMDEIITELSIDSELLEKIQYCIPLLPEEAPVLFDSGTPMEFWLLLQDCFFLTPGVFQLLDQDEIIMDD